VAILFLVVLELRLSQQRVVAQHRLSPMVMVEMVALVVALVVLLVVVLGVLDQQEVLVALEQIMVQEM
jgi:hypothetical protein